MGDLMRLLLGDGPEGDGPGRDGTQDGGVAEVWSGRGRRPRVADSREWCGTGLGDDGIGALGAVLRGQGRGRVRGRVIRGR